MSGGTGYHNRGIVFAAKISNLLRSLDWATCREISPKVEYWIDYALTEQSVNADDLVDQLSPMMWENRSSDPHVVRFLKEFHDAPHRSEQARSFVDNFCSRVLRSFAAASAEDLGRSYRSDVFKIAACGGEGFVRAASLVGHLIEFGLLDRKLVRRHLIKPLITHQYTGRDYQHKSFRARAIYQLLVIAGRTLLQGLLEPEDVRVCFETLNSEIPSGGVVGLDADTLSVTCGAYSNALHRDLNFSPEIPWNPRKMVRTITDGEGCHGGSRTWGRRRFLDTLLRQNQSTLTSAVLSPPRIFVTRLDTTALFSSSLGTRRTSSESYYQKHYHRWDCFACTVRFVRFLKEPHRMRRTVLSNPDLGLTGSAPASFSSSRWLQQRSLNFRVSAA